MALEESVLGRERSITRKRIIYSVISIDVSCTSIYYMYLYIGFMDIQSFHPLQLTLNSGFTWHLIAWRAIMTNGATANNFSAVTQTLALISCNN